MNVLSQLDLRFEPLRDEDVEILRHPLDFRELRLLKLLLSCEAPRGLFDSGRFEDQLDDVVDLLNCDIDRMLVEMSVGLIKDRDLRLRSLLMVLVATNEGRLRVACLYLLLASKDLRRHPRCHTVHFNKAGLFFRTSRRTYPLVIRLCAILVDLDVLQSDGNFIEKLFIDFHSISSLSLTGIHHGMVGHLEEAGFKDLLDDLQRRFLASDHI